jgi:polyisoprenoid-binding protein YceI
VLRGEDNTVVGTTQQVAGDIRINVDNPAQSEMGTIAINARDLATDSTNRNRSLQQFILLSAQDQYEFITFAPTALNNLPDSVRVGRAFSFEVVGNLTVIGNTRAVTFQTTVTPTSRNEITGFAEATVNHADFNISIPRMDFVASVADEVTLHIDFVATRVNLSQLEAEATTASTTD